MTHRLVGVAQLVRAPGCGPGGRGFETPRPPQTLPRLCIQSWWNEYLAIPHVARLGCHLHRAPLAQLVEQRTLNPQVLGSSPRGRTTFS